MIIPYTLTFCIRARAEETGDPLDYGATMFFKASTDTYEDGKRISLPVPMADAIDEPDVQKEIKKVLGKMYDDAVRTLLTMRQQEAGGSD